MKSIKYFKMLLAALPVALALGLMPSIASAGTPPGFVGNASKELTKVGSGCLHTARWKSDMGECGAPPAPPKPPVGDSDGDGVNDDKDRCPGTPKGTPVDAEGCGIDSDGDGVADYEDQCAGTPRGNRVNTSGCELITKITVPGVNFDFDKATLKDAAKSTLDDAAAQINRNSNAVKAVQVTGYTDSTGPEAYNLALSERRANSVKSYLEGKGVSNVSATGAGESNPVADNATRDGRAKNRRVEIDVKM